MQRTIIQITGIALTLFYAMFIVWLYNSQPASIAEISTKAAVTARIYEIDQTKFAEGLQLFRAENYPAARDFFSQADREKRDARTQFYIAYSFYREGWGRVYNDDALFRSGLDAITTTIALDPDFKADDSDLKIKTPVELRHELETGLETKLDDLNPLKVLRERK